MKTDENSVRKMIENNDKVYAWVANNLKIGDFVTFKGSRSNKNYYRKVLNINNQGRPEEFYVLNPLYHYRDYWVFDPVSGTNVRNPDAWIHLQGKNNIIYILSQNVNRKTNVEEFIVASNNASFLDTIFINGEWKKIKDLI